MLFWQTKVQTVAIEDTISKNKCVSNLEETVSVHTILTGTLDVKKDLKETGSDIPKNYTADNDNDFPTFRLTKSM